MRVETYIQSGNVLFEAEEDDNTLRMKIEETIDKNFGFSALVILRTEDEWRKLVSECPFSAEEIAAAEAANTEGESLYVALLSKEVPEDKAECLNKYQTREDRLQINKKDIYLLLRHSIRNSNLANNLHKIDTSMTVRNWNTILKLMTNSVLKGSS
jgi:uncharacterized protein (DUF1697 family)